MQNVITLRTELRDKKGKGVCKKIRKEKKIPAVIYGEGKENLLAVVELAELKKVLKSEMGINSILELVAGKKKENVMIKEVQYDYLQRDIVHVDFLRINLEQPVEVNVHIFLQGEPVGVKQEGGLLEFVNREVTVKCLPLQIPHEITVDISQLHAGHSIKVADLPHIEGVQYVSPANSVICLVAKEAEEEAPAVAEQAAATPAAQTEKKTETASKKE